LAGDEARGTAVLSRSIKSLPGTPRRGPEPAFLLCMGLFSLFFVLTTRQARFMVRKVME